MREVFLLLADLYFMLLIIYMLKKIKEIRINRINDRLKRENTMYLVDNVMLARKLDTAKIFNKEAEKLKELIKTKGKIELSDIGYKIIIDCDNDEAKHIFDFIHEKEVSEDSEVIPYEL